MHSLKIEAAALIILALAAATSTIASAEGGFTLEVSPGAANILRGGSVEYKVEAASIDSYGTLNIQLSGLPSESNYTINPASALMKPGVKANMTITVTTSVNTPIGSYSLNITGWVRDLAHIKTVTLNVLSEMLYVTLSTDRKFYSQSEIVEISGRVVEAQNIGVEEVEVSIELVDPNLTHIESTKTYTNLEGYFQQELEIRSDAPQGTYIILVEAFKTGFKETRGYTVITVGSKKPSVAITSIYTTDVNGASQTVFNQGAAAIVWTEVTNTGGDLTNGLVWVQIEDPNGATVTVMFQIANIRQGEKFKAGFSLTLSSSQPLGQYTAKAFVSDKLIAQGGRFLTPPKQVTFTVTT